MRFSKMVLLYRVDPSAYSPIWKRELGEAFTAFCQSIWGQPTFEVDGAKAALTPILQAIVENIPPVENMDLAWKKTARIQNMNSVFHLTWQHIEFYSCSSIFMATTISVSTYDQ